MQPKYEAGDKLFSVQISMTQEDTNDQTDAYARLPALTDPVISPNDGKK